MTYLVFITIAAILFNIVHIYFIHPAWRESIRLSATKELVEIKNISYLSAENREYVEKLKTILEFVVNNNSTITMLWFVKNLIEIENESKDEEQASAYATPILTDEVKAIKEKTIHLFHLSMANNSLMLFIYLLPLAITIKVITAVLSLFNKNHDENNIIKIYEHNRNRHA